MKRDVDRRLAAATQITAEASKLTMQHFRRLSAFETKADHSPVTLADQATERVIREMLAQEFPGEPIFGEEFGSSAEAERTWIIDPIDGTRSFLVGLPLFGMLLGYHDPGGTSLGVIRMPALNEVFTGAANEGAAFNGSPIHVSDCRALKEARLFIHEGDKLAAEQAERFDRIARAGALRRMGADCYGHALVAAGMADAVIDYDLQPYDFLPVCAVVQGAGGLMTDWQGNALSLHSDGRTLTAATPELHAELVQLVNP